jgi:membrane associated rhomboid family serine protease
MFFIPYGTAEVTRKRRFHWVTLSLVAANIAVFALEVIILSNLGEAGLEAFLRRYAFIPDSLQGVSPLLPGLITAMFLHAGLLHIAGNMLYLLPFGDNVEDRLGHARYLLFYLLCGIIASLAFGFFNSGSNIPLVGASGAIGGILGGYLALHPRGSRVRGFFVFIVIPFKVELPAWLFIGYWFVVQLLSSAAVFTTDTAAGSDPASNVAFLAHVGGFLAGLVLAPLLALQERHNPPEPPAPVNDLFISRR